MKNTQIKNAKVTNVTNEKKVVVKQIDEVTIVADNVKGKTLSKLQTAKIESNKANKVELGTLSFNLMQLKKHAANYVVELNLTIEQIENIKPSQFVTFLTEKENERLKKNGNLFTFWLVLSLIGRYSKSIK